MERYPMLMAQRLHAFKMTVLPEVVCRFSAAPIKIPPFFFKRVLNHLLITHDNGRYTGFIPICSKCFVVLLVRGT